MLFDEMLPSYFLATGGEYLQSRMALFHVLLVSNDLNNGVSKMANSFDTETKLGSLNMNIRYSQ